MPELPEVETMCRGIAPVVGSRIRDLRRPRSRLQPIKISPRLSDFRRRVVGSKIVAVGRVGKRVVVELDSGDRVVFEPRMTGLVLLAHPPDLEHLRLVFELSGRLSYGGTRSTLPSEGRILFWNRRGLGVVRLLSPRQFHRDCGPQRLGPDALQISAETLSRRLGASGRAIKVALLDQRAVAGIGNLYASEILHRVRIHPQRTCDSLRPQEWRRLHAAMREVLEEAIRQQGSTLRDGTYRVARNRPGSYQVFHRVYQRAGQRCLQCGEGEIVRIVQAQRSTFFCRVCQPKRSRR
jgi:formamidopyrimidine-DNA glycosylase